MDFIKEIKKWLDLKIKLWTHDKGAVFKQGEVWWCSLGLNLGEEIFGKGEKFSRPVLVFKKFTSNSFMGLPLTTHGRKGSWYVGVKVKDTKQWVLLNQARILDKKRLIDKLEDMRSSDFKLVRERFIEFYGS